MLDEVTSTLFALSRRADDNEEGGDGADKEVVFSWGLCINIILLIIAFFTSYILQQKKVQAIHETVISIFAGSSYPPT